MTVTLNSLFALIAHLHFILFFFGGWENVLLFGRHSFVSSFCLTLCVCFYVLCISATFPSFERVAIRRRCPVVPSDAISTWSPELYAPGYPMCGLHMSSCFGAAGTLVGEAGPWPGWLRGLATTVVGIWGWSTRAGATLEEHQHWQGLLTRWGGVRAFGGQIDFFNELHSMRDFSEIQSESCLYL